MSTSGCDCLNSRKMALSSSNTGSTRAWMFSVAERETSVMKLVKQETMQVFDVVRIERRLSAKDDSLRQVITWNENRKTVRYNSKNLAR